MGYAYVLTADNKLLAGTAAAEITATLLAATGDSYPAGGAPPATVGPWSVAAVCHSTDQTHLTASATGIRSGAPAVDDGETLWVPTVGLHREAELSKELHRNPVALQRLQEGIEAGRDPLDVVFGPDRSSGAPTSVWLLYGDALFNTNLDRSLIGDRILEAARSRRQLPVAFANHSNALSCYGSVLPGGDVHLMFSGNRLCRPEELTDHELQQLHPTR